MRKKVWKNRVIGGEGPILSAFSAGWRGRATLTRSFIMAKKTTKKKTTKKTTKKPAAAAAKKPAAAEPAPPAAPPAAAPKWTTAEVNKMTVPKLKAALTELGLDTSGLKAVLKERLMGSGAVGN